MTFTPTSSSLSGTASPALLLWSTNTHLKYRIQQMFRRGVHYVWCSPAFEGAALGRYAVGAGQPASSDPCTIYRQLHQAVQTTDRGDGKIVSQKKTLKALALKWHKDGEITLDARSEIFAMVKEADLIDWRPLVYAIPYALIGSRATLVPRQKRASNEPEYVITDLTDAEFHIIEPIPCR